MTEKGVTGLSGPSASFERECERLRPLGEAYVLRRFGGQLNHADAEDAVAEVLIRLHQRAAQGETPENLRAAFFTSVRNAAIDQLRARGARPTVALDAANGLRRRRRRPDRVRGDAGGIGRFGRGACRACAGTIGRRY